MNRLYKPFLISLIFCLFSVDQLHNHGFGGNTFIEMGSGYWELIEQVAHNELKQRQIVKSYFFQCRSIAERKILRRGVSRTNCYFTLSCSTSPCLQSDIICTPLQEFYLPEKQRWVPAWKLHVGDLLLTSNNTHVPITAVAFVEAPLEVYSIEVEDTHSFFVGNNSVLTHNMVFAPIAIIGSEAAAAAASSCGFGLIAGGPVGFLGSLIANGVAFGVVYAIVKRFQRKPASYQISATPTEIARYRDHARSQRQKGNAFNDYNSPGFLPPEDPNKKRSTDKVGNMYELFKREGFGKRLQECSEGTKHRYDGAKIFRMTRDLPEYGLYRDEWYYLDTLHYDHIEVFNHNGTRPTNVLNLDGTRHIEKLKTSIKQARSIKDYIQ